MAVDVLAQILAQERQIDSELIIRCPLFALCSLLSPEQKQPESIRLPGGSITSPPSKDLNQFPAHLCECEPPETTSTLLVVVVNHTPAVCVLHLVRRQLPADQTKPKYYRHY